MKSKDIVGCFFGLFFIIGAISFIVHSKKTIVEKSGIIEFKLDATYKSSSTLFIFRLVNEVEKFDAKVSVDDYNNYNKGDEYTHQMITHINNTALALGVICSFICIIIVIIYFAD